MEPKVSMTAYAVFDGVMLLLLAATGREQAALLTSLGWTAVCALFAAIYLARLRRSRRPRPGHRSRLDRWVLAQWSVAPAIVVLAVWLLDMSFLDGAGRFLDAVSIGAAVGGLGVYVSAIVDWYLILPAVSGIVSPAPCQAPARERWARVSKLWFFHRGAATILVTLCVISVLGYMAQTADDAGGGSERLAWVGAILVSGVVFYRYQNGALTSLWWGLRAPRHVGDIVKLEDGGIAYVVDLAVQGANYMRLDDDRSYRGARFPYKKDDEIPLERLSRVKPHNPGDSDALRAPCRDHSGDCSPPTDWCSGVNWYCRCNPDAHR